ncbi:MAG: DNA-3-methyladenine glycosylase [Rhizobiaceae bacterium]
MRRITSPADVAEGLDALLGLDPRLEPVRAAVDEVPLRLAEPGFASLASIIVSQQVSRASADAIMGRLIRLVDPLTPDGFVAAGEGAWREAGLSQPKMRTLTAVSEALASGALDLSAIGALEGDEAIARLTAVHGIGPWTAQVYLLFCAGHPDIFPAGDVALQSAVGEALGLSPRPGHRALEAIAESWAPWRGVAARLFWAFYRVRRGRDALPAG